MSTLKLAELKENRNLPTAGSKLELVKRLLEAGASAEELHTEEGTWPEESRVQPDEPQAGMSVQVAPTQREIEILRKERYLAAREAEILRRELELLRMSTPHETTTPNRNSTGKWQELKDLVGEFNGNDSDFDRWERQVRKLLAAYDLDNHRAKALVCSRLTGKALKWYHSRADCIELSHNDLLRELKKMYGLRPDPLLLRREFEARS